MSENKGKGKGRANDTQDSRSNNDGASTKAPEAPDQTSMLSKITSSAAGLASSAFSAPRSNEIDDGRAALLGDSKSIPSGLGSTSSGAESSSGASRVVPGNYQSTAFRGEHVEQHAQQMESEFSSFLDGVDQFVPNPDAISQLNGNHMANHGDDLFAPTQNAFLRSTRQGQQSSSGPDHYLRNNDLTIQEQEALDGTDVIGILTSPSAMEESIDIEEDNLEELDLQLTPEQINNIRSITTRLFPPARPHMTPPIDHPLNLHPTLDLPRMHSIDPNMPVECPRTVLTAQWDEVLTGYTDEVWGGLLPLVKEARQEVEAMKADDNPDLPPKALRRLEMIFKHLQK